VQKGKLKVKSVNDFTSETARSRSSVAGVDAEKTGDALYAFTICEVSIAEPHRRIRTTARELDLSEIIDGFDLELALLPPRLRLDAISDFRRGRGRDFL